MADDYLAGLSHAQLYNMRGQTVDPAQQALLGPYEHRAFAREITQENPLMALPVAAAIPIYAAYKASGLSGARSPASLDEIGQGYTGLYEGLAKLLQSR